MTITLPVIVYLVQHTIVMIIALSRPSPAIADHTLGATTAVAVAYTYPYAQVLYLEQTPAVSLGPTPGAALVVCGALVSLVSLCALGRRFGVRPAVRGLMTGGPYRVVRHPMYSGYLLSDVGYALCACNPGTLVLAFLGWVAMLYRIDREERVLARHVGWTTYAGTVPFRLIPHLW